MKHKRMNEFIANKYGFSKISGDSNILCMYITRQNKINKRILV